MRALWEKFVAWCRTFFEPTTRTSREEDERFERPPPRDET